MFSIDQYLDSLRHETRICAHLATKIPPGALDWRPTPAQRSTLELLRYLTWCMHVPVRAVLAGHWDDAERIEKESAEVTLETFPAAMERQLAEVERLVRSVPEKDLIEREGVMPWGTKVPLGRALVDVSLKPLVAYRMQLFLYAKQSGNASIGPANCWVGVDAPPRT